MEEVLEMQRNKIEISNFTDVRNYEFDQVFRVRTTSEDRALFD